MIYWGLPQCDILTQIIKNEHQMSKLISDFELGLLAGVALNNQIDVHACHAYLHGVHTKVKHLFKTI